MPYATAASDAAGSTRLIVPMGLGIQTVVEPGRDNAVPRRRRRLGRRAELQFALICPVSTPVFRSEPGGRRPTPTGR